MAWASNFNDFKGHLGGGEPQTKRDNPRYGNRSSNANQQFTVPSLYGNKPNTYTSNSGGRTMIRDLNPGIPSTWVVGVIIAKEDPRHFPDKKDHTKERWVLSFTIRDSPQDFINASAWGSEQYIKDLAGQFRIADVVELRHVGVQSKPTDGSGDKFRPTTPSLYQLSMGENRGTFNLYHGEDMANYNQFSHLQVKPDNDFYTIEAIQESNQALNGEYLNILAMVKKVPPYKDITTKDGRVMQRCEVKLFDKTSMNFSLVLWNSELIFLAQSWAPKEHVLFIADARVTHDDFRNCMIATATSKSIITLDPNFPEARSLFDYGQSIELTEEGNGTGYIGNSVDLNSIHELCNIGELKTKCVLKGDGGGVAYCYSYAFLTSLDIDHEDVYNAVSTRCARCRFRVHRETGTCTNQNCPQGSLPELGREKTETETTFDTRVSYSDHSATVTNCYMSGDVVESMLGCQVLDFLNMTEDQKTDLKWTILLERCKIYFKVFLPTFEKPNVNLRIISCVKADVEEATKAMH